MTGSVTQFATIHSVTTTAGTVIPNVWPSKQ